MMPSLVILCLLATVMASSTSLEKQLTQRRLLSELRDIKKYKLLMEHPFNSSSPDECGIRLLPVRNNLLEWHFSFTGVNGSQYEHGVYHGRIFLHPEYPRKAPSISIMTPSGRWEVNKEICLSASNYHQETWDPQVWNLRTLVLALRGHMLTYPREIGAIMTSSATQRTLASSSRSWFCPICRTSHAHLLGAREASSLSSPSWPLKQASQLTSSKKAKKILGKEEPGAIKVRSRRRRWEVFTRTAAYAISISMFLLQVWLLLGRVAAGFTFGTSHAGEHWVS